jgi:hypothetical protein
MLQRGRKSSAALVAPAVDGQPPRLQPPTTMSDGERAVFVELVEACDRKHFRVSDVPLLAAYCRAIVLEQRAAGELATDPTNARWLQVWEKSGRALVSFSARLKLSPQARLHNRTVARQQPPGPRPWSC